MIERKKSQKPLDGSQELQAWASIRKRLSTLQELEKKGIPAIEAVNGIHVKLSSASADSLDGSDLPAKALAAYDVLGQNVSEQERLINETLESLSVLIGLRTSAEANQSQERRKKRKLDALSPSDGDSSGSTGPSARPMSRASISAAGSAASSRKGSPAPLSIPPGSSVHGVKHSGVSQSVHNPSSITPTFSATYPLSKILSKKSRKEQLAPQLPLREGRRVAFRQPVNRGTGKGGTSTVAANSSAAAEREEWILAVVTKCIQGDKNRYEVQDVQDAEGADGKAGALFNTTLKAIVPLPDPEDRVNTYPEQDYGVGTEIMALYPDTTSFYRAQVVGLPGNGKKQAYKVIFEDDDDDIKNVPVEFVAEWPK